MHQNFKGTGVALVTPFREDGNIDFSALEQLVHSVTKGGVDYLVALGTTSESPTLSHEEKQNILYTIINCNKGSLPVVCGMGGNNTREVIHNINTFDLKGVSALLLVTPYYNKPTQEGLYCHFEAIATATKHKIILYNVPGRSSCNMLPATVIRLAGDFKNIIGIKEASGNITQCMELLAMRPKGFLVLSGDDNLVLAQMALGMDGIISVAANCFPRDFSKLINLIIEEKFDKARNLLYKLLPAIDLLFAEGNPSGVKSFLAQMGKCENLLRLPLVPVSTDTSGKVRIFLKNFK